jgi:hypothetical protein
MVGQSRIAKHHVVPPQLKLQKMCIIGDGTPIFFNYQQLQVVTHHGLQKCNRAKGTMNLHSAVCFPDVRHRCLAWPGAQHRDAQSGVSLQPPSHYPCQRPRSVRLPLPATPGTGHFDPPSHVRRVNMYDRRRPSQAGRHLKSQNLRMSVTIQSRKKTSKCY